MTNKLKELRELTLFFARFGNTLDTSLADGKITWFEIAAGAFELGGSLREAFNGIQAIKDELRTATEEDLQALYADIAIALNLRSHHAEVIAEKAVHLALTGADFIIELRRPAAPVVVV